MPNLMSELACAKNAVLRRDYLNAIKYLDNYFVQRASGYKEPCAGGDYQAGHALVQCEDGVDELARQIKRVRRDHSKRLIVMRQLETRSDATKSDTVRA